MYKRQIYDYDIPQALRELYASKDYGRWATTVDGRKTVPVCFLATNHTTGGNSGSPIINDRGELIGLNFDRTWRSTMSDVAFDETICRNIAVDVRYVLFVIDLSLIHIYGPRPATAGHRRGAAVGALQGVRPLGGSLAPIRIFAGAGRRLSLIHI